MGLRGLFKGELYLSLYLCTLPTNNAAVTWLQTVQSATDWKRGRPNEMAGLAVTKEQ